MYRYKRYGEINNALQDIQNMESTASETPQIITKEELKNCVNNIQEQQSLSTNNANVASSLSNSNQKHNNRSMNVHSKRRRDETHMDLLILQQEVNDTKVFSDKTAGRKAAAQVAAAAVQANKVATANFANAVNVGMRPGAGSSGVATANPPRKKGKIGLLSDMASQLSDSSMVAPPKVPSFINKKVNGKTSAKKGAAGLLAPIAVRASNYKRILFGINMSV